MRYKEFAERLAQLRKQKGISARKMSLTIEKVPDFIYNIENGDELPLVTDFFAICDYLGITPREFFEFEDNFTKSHAELLNPTENSELITILNELKTVIIDTNEKIKKLGL